MSIDSFRLTRKRRAARIAAARCLLTGNSQVPTAAIENLYMSGPFQQGTKQQGPQSPLTAAQQYRKALAALDEACRGKYSGKGFADLSDDQKDEVITGLEKGSLKLDGFDGQSFFTLILTDTRNGFLADPIYGGNKEHGRMEDDRFPRHALRLSRLDRPPQRARHVADRQYRRSSNWSSQ